MFSSGTWYLFLSVINQFSRVILFRDSFQNALVLPLVRFYQEKGLQISASALFGPLSERKVDTGSAECGLVQWNWHYPRCFVGCLGKFSSKSDIVSTSFMSRIF